MPRRVIESAPIPTAEAKRILERAKEEELGEFQRRTRDYAAKFSKLSPAKAEKLVRELTDKLQLDRKEAIQITNSMPSSVEEVRTILTVKGKIVGGSQLQSVLKLVDSYRED